MSIGDSGLRERSYRSGVAFPIAIYAAWRLTHLLVLVLFEGSPSDAMHAFDAGYFRSILREGYLAPPGGYSEGSNVAFFPGLTWVTEPVLLLVGDERLATALVANALALAAFMGVWGAVRAWSDAACARRAVLALALFPTSYYLWMYYSEALLISTSAAAAWANQRGRHVPAAGFLVLAATARVVGVLVGPVLALARVVRLRRVDATALLYLGASAAGFVAVLGRQQVEIGDAFGWTRAQEAWGRELAPPWSPILTALKDILNTLPALAEGVGLDLVTVFVVGALVVLLFRGVAHGRWPLEAALLALAFWSVPLFSRLISSQIRFALVCWPILLIAADSWPRMRPLLRVALLVLAVGMTVVLLRRLALGAFTA